MSFLPESTLAVLAAEVKKLEAKHTLLVAEVTQTQKALNYLRKVMKGATSPPGERAKHHHPKPEAPASPTALPEGRAQQKDSRL